MKIRIAVTLIALAILSGCYIGQPPDFLVKLTGRLPESPTACTGVLVRGDIVATAAHCADDAKRVVVYSDDALLVDEVLYSEYTDLALLVLDGEFVNLQFPNLAEPQEGVGAQVHGLCPFFWGGNARTAEYDRRYRWPFENAGPYFDDWVLDGDKVCGGDSGGIVMQEGTVVGIMIALNPDTPFSNIGGRFATVPAYYITELLGELE